MEKLYVNKTSANNKRSIKFMSFVVLFLGGLINIYSQVAVDFDPRTSVYTVKGDFTMLGNTNLTLVNYNDNSTNNNDMRYVDIDGNPNTWNSSSSTLVLSNENGALPECSNVLFAGLYWFGRANVGNDDNDDGDNNPNTFSVTKGSETKSFDKTKVLINGPGSSLYEEIQANVLSGDDEIYFPSGIDQNIYTAYADITDYVNDTSKGGVGEYFVADMALKEGSSDVNGLSGGWGMVIVYENSKMNWRDITVFDGHAFVGGTGGAERFSFDVAGFNAALGGDVNIKLGVMASEGERNFTSDYLEIEVLNTGAYQRLTHGATNSDSNFFTSSILTVGNVRNPSLFNNTGVDILMFDIPNIGNSIIANGQNATSFGYGSSSDGYAIFNLTFAVDAYVPEPVGVLTNTAINGVPNPVNSALEPGENADFQIQLTNRGTEAITSTALTIPIPTSVDASSLTINNNINFTPSAGYSEPVYDSNTNLGPNGAIVWNLGTFPLPANPDTILADISFKITATQDCSVLNNLIDTEIITNGFLSGTGAVSSISFNTELITGYEQNGACIGEPIPAPIIIVFDYESYISEPPTADIPAPINVQCNTDVPVPDISVVTNASSNSGIPPTVLFDSDTSDGNTCPEIITRRYSVTDDCSNIIFVNQTITVNDTTIPEISGIIAESTEEGCSATDTSTPVSTVADLESLGLTISDNCTDDANLVVTSEDIITVDTCPFVVTRTYTITDTCDNSTTATQIINITDDTPPVLTGVPADTTVNPNDIPVAPTVAATDNCSAIPLGVVVTESTTPGICAGTYTLTRTWTAADECGNTISESQIINVTDLTPPVLAGVPDNTDADCASIPVVPIVTATDGSSTIPLGVIFTESTTPGICAGTYTLTRTWTATDECGNTTSESQIINVTDLTPPVLAGVPANTDADCASIPIVPAVTATDNCSAIPLAVVFAESTTPGICAGTYTLTRTWTAADECGNTTSESQIINVTDLTPPVLAGVPDNTDADCTSIPVAPIVTAIDNCSAIPLVVVFTESITPGICAGTYTLTRTWTATDECGNTTSESQIINVTDITPPVLAGVPAGTTVSPNDIPVAPIVTAIDNCSAIPLGVVFAESTTPGICAGTYTLTRTWTAADECGNTTSESQIINVTDLTPPVLSGVPDNTDADCASIPVAPIVTATDGSSTIPLGVILTESTTPGICAGTYTLTRTWTATDECGNTTSESQIINVTDIAPPVLAGVPADTTVSPNDIPVVPTVTATDNCSTIPLGVVFAESTTPGICAGTYTLTRTWTAADECGNTTSESQIINVTDLTPPVLSGVPDNTDADCASIPVAPIVTATDGSSTIPLDVVLTESTTPGICAGTYTLTRTWTATDECGNTTSESQIINVTDTTPPVLAGVPAGTTVSPNDIPLAPTVTATDNCSAIPLGVALTESTTPGICAGTYTLTRTWTAADECGNTISESQIINVTDLTPPVLAGVPDNTDADCASIPVAPIVTATDGSSTIPLGVILTESTTPGICAGTYTLTRTWTATDECGNTTSESQIINVTDITPPVLAGVPTNTDADCASIPAVPDVTATDNCSAIPLAVVFAESTTPGICAGTYTLTRTWTAADECGNTTSESQIINVTDLTPPVLSGVPANADVDCASIPVAPTVTANDNCTGIPLGAVFTESTIPGICAGTYTLTRTWTATDECDNTTSESQIINVTDLTPPVLILPSNETAECSDDLSPIDFGTATATDNCDDNPEVTFSDVRTDGVCSGTFTITRTWTATDICGNTVSANQTISTSDTTAPTFDQTVLPEDTAEECGTVPLPEVLTASDNCGDATVTVDDVRTDGNCDNNYVIERTYTATDDCGLTNTHIQTITVQDTTPPTFDQTLPEANVIVECDAIPEPIELTATDSCGSASVSLSDIRTDGDCENNYSIARTWTATDDCDNATTYTQIITVQDSKTPEFVDILPRDTTVECDAIPNAEDITATDNCGTATVSVVDLRTDGDCPSNYIIARTWTATDLCGLTTSHTQTITVQDTTAPVATSSFEPLIDVSCTDVPEAPALEFTDNCSTNVIVEFDETSSFDDTSLQDYEIIRTWTVRDACNNEEVYTQTLNVTLDEIFTEVFAEDRCFEEGIINLNNNLPSSLNTDGIWEMVEGNPDAPLKGSLFNPTVLELSEDFLPKDGGIDYLFRYTTTDMGCVSVTEVIMNIHADCIVLPCGEDDIVISKAITPNGDGYNDTFDIAGIDLCGFVAEVKLFNRWGALVYESNNYTLGSIETSGAKGDWDGSAPNSSIGGAGKLPNGTYYFIISLKNSGLSPLTGPVYLGTK